MKKDKLVKLFLLVVLATLLLTACGTENPMKNVPLEGTNQVYGFWNGVWDGMTATLAFIGNLFGGHYGIYQVHNNGNWYDFGYLLGLGSLGTLLSFFLGSLRLVVAFLFGICDD